MLLSFLIVLSFCSCVTEKQINGIPITSKELETIDILGFVETNFEATISYDEKVLLQKGYDELLIIARKQYTGDIDIKNIVLEKRVSYKNLWYALVGITTWYYITVHAKGIVIKI